MSEITTISGGDAISSSRTVINTNFSNLNADKIETLGDLNITATSTELNYTDGVTSAIQAQIDSKDNFITGEIRAVAIPEGDIPTGWLICDGAAVLRSTYDVLYSAIGDAFGAGNGTTTFNVPDMRGRVAVGKDDMGQGSADVITDTEADTLGGTFGSETHTLSADEIPDHTHDAYVVNGGSGVYALNSSNSGALQSDAIPSSGGGGNAHNNVQPSVFLNYIIKT